ncbi:MAG: ribosome small subunit-dependent GTPase A [Spirochaetaceae bacterium]|jgi:ribosome biogenesis GTPase|nr:ribosome small subunit-dependent GTPase A [Spirochaetaceae bacterium]
MMYSNVVKYGLSDCFEQEAALYPDLFLARVVGQHRDRYGLVSERGELAGTVSGRLQYGAEGSVDFPAVGDWVMVDRADDRAGAAVIRNILSRKSLFVRKAAGTKASESQVIAANIDTVFICMSLNADFSLRRLERYLTIAWDSGATPVVVLTKADLCADLGGKIDEVASVAMGADVAACSMENSGGLDTVREYIQPGKTVACIGSSGVGKSTLVNCLAGEKLLATHEIREHDDKGRHTTTRRELVLLPNGGIVIDTPGMREIAVYNGNLTRAFEDIEKRAAQCKFGDCSHSTEPGCAVRQAVENGELSQKRFENWLKLGRETLYDGLNSRQRENEKINRMFGSKAEMKQMFRHIKGKKS